MKTIISYRKGKFNLQAHLRDLRAGEYHVCSVTHWTCRIFDDIGGLLNRDGLSSQKRFITFEIGNMPRNNTCVGRDDVTVSEEYNISAVSTHVSQTPYWTNKFRTHGTTPSTWIVSALPSSAFDPCACRNTVATGLPTLSKAATVYTMGLRVRI